MTAPSPAVPSDAAALPSGARMPLLGFGTWQLTGDAARSSTAAALSAGYRHLDTATIYGNEREVGAALAQADGPVFSGWAAPLPRWSSGGTCSTPRS